MATIEQVQALADKAFKLKRAAREAQKLLKDAEVVKQTMLHKRKDPLSEKEVEAMQKISDDLFKQAKELLSA